MTDVSIRKLTAASAVNEVFSEVPTGAINDANTNFVLAHTPDAGTLAVYLNGARQQVATDYTLATATITFLAAPLTGSILLCDYQYA